MRASSVTAVLALLVAGALQPAAAQSLNDVGRVLQDQLLGNRQNPNSDRDAYERGRQDQSEANRREDEARRRAGDDRRRFDNEQQRRRYDDSQQRPREFDRQREDRQRDDRQRDDQQRGYGDDQRNRQQYRR